MKTSSGKAKGRRLQQLVRTKLRLKAIQLDKNLLPEDIESRGMGQQGVDIILSPAAQLVFPLDIECKNVEKLNVINVFSEHYQKYKYNTSRKKILVHSKNHIKALIDDEALVTMRLNDFLELLS